MLRIFKRFVCLFKGHVFRKLEYRMPFRSAFQDPVTGIWRLGQYGFLHGGEFSTCDRCGYITDDKKDLDYLVIIDPFNDSEEVQ